MQVEPGRLTIVSVPNCLGSNQISCPGTSLISTVLVGIVLPAAAQPGWRWGQGPLGADAGTASGFDAAR